MIRALAQKVDALFKDIGEGPSLESALFRGGSDDGYWDARQLLDLLFDGINSLREECGGEDGWMSDEELIAATNVRNLLSPQELETVREIQVILKVHGE